MNNKSSFSHSFIKNPIFWVICGCLFYWTFLYFSTHFIIAEDADNYEKLGRLLQQRGWLAYFQTGPNREPLFPWLISLSMQIAQLLNISYQAVQKIFHFGLLFMTQILTLLLLRKMRIHNGVCALIILYVGISPGLVNSAVSLYSEIATYPLILGLILMTHRAWEEINSVTSSFFYAIILAFLALAVTFTKALFAFIIPSFILILMFASWFLCRPQDRLSPNYLFTVGCIFLVIFFGGIHAYKQANEIHNGAYALTNRGPWALYGNTIRRMQPLTETRLLTAMAYIPGKRVCENLFSPEKCAFWSAKKSDDYGLTALQQLRQQKFSQEEINQVLIGRSLKTMLGNPAQYTLFMGLEGLKMFFWESTKIGYADYPPVLDHLFYWTPFKNSLRLILAVLTLTGFLYAFIYLYQISSTVALPDSPRAPSELLFIINLFILLYILFYSFFYILTRYALPIAPLYLANTAFLLNQFFKKGLRVS